MSGSCGAGCPYGLTCTAPGQCPRFTDSGGDGICDLAQPTSSSTETSYSDDSYSGSSESSGSVDDPSSAVTSEPVNTSSDANASAATDQGTGLESGSIPTDDPQYFVLPISILLVGLYLLTHLLFTKGILSQKKHRRLWNLLLTAGTMGSGITGILLILIINLSIKTALNPSITFWHAELSILMVIGTLIHIHLYWKPFKNMFRVLFGFKNFKLKNSKKPASILAGVLLISMVIVSGQYLSSHGDYDANISSLNSANNTTDGVNTTTANYQDSQSTATISDQNGIYETEQIQDVQDTSTTGNAKGNGKNRV